MKFYSKILIIGGTGYIGTPLVKKLQNAGYELTLLVKNERDFRDEFFGCKHFVADLLDKESLMKNINHFDLIINLAAVIRTLNKKKYQENILGMKNLIEVLEKKRINKLVYFSTQNVNLKDKGPYAKSKAEAEKLLLASRLDYMIIRPNYVYSIDIHNDFYRMASFAKKFRVMPMIGKGDNKIQPIFKEDLINIVFGFIEYFQPKTIIEISGSESVSIGEIGTITRECLKKNCPVVCVPVAPLKLFKHFIPFDIDGYAEDRISSNPFSGYEFSSFRENLKKIINLLK